MNTHEKVTIQGHYFYFAKKYKFDLTFDDYTHLLMHKGGNIKGPKQIVFFFLKKRIILAIEVESSKKN